MPHTSLPQISFVIFDVVTSEERHKLLLKRSNSMMFLLLSNVMLQLVYV